MDIKLKAPLVGTDYRGQPRTLDIDVTDAPDNHSNHLTPAVARKLAKALNRAADFVENAGNAQADVDALLAPDTDAAPELPLQEVA